MLSPLPNDNILDANGNISRTWNNWLNNLKNLVNFGESAQNVDVTADQGISVISNKMRIQSVTSGAITITRDPQISAGFDGQFLHLEGRDDVKTVQLDNGKGLKLKGAASFVVGNNDVIMLHYNAAKSLWIEDYRSDN